MRKTKIMLEEVTLEEAMSDFIEFKRAQQVTILKKMICH